MVVQAPTATQAAEAVAAILDDGQLALLTATDGTHWDGVHAALPELTRRLCVADAPLPLTAAEMRELRWLLGTATEDRASRPRQRFPPPGSLPAPERLAELCPASGADPMVSEPVELIPGLLRELPPGRHAVLLDAARSCRDALLGLDAAGIGSWTRPLLERVVFGDARATLDAARRCTAEVENMAEALHGGGYRMSLVGPVPPRGVERLEAYLRHLELGGLPRRYLLSNEQRMATPVLRQLGLERAGSHDVPTLREAVLFLRLTVTMRRAATWCEELGAPTPRPVPAAIRRRHRELERVARAARSVELLRREVLFIHPTSPVPVPDLAATELVADAIVRASGSGRAAADELTAAADAVAASLPAGTPAPEVGELVAAIRSGSVPAYSEALARLGRAAGDASDQRRQDELLARLRATAPALAQAWTEPDAHRQSRAAAWFRPLPELGDSPPTPGSADVIVLLGADALTAEAARLLPLTSDGPRLVAVCAQDVGRLSGPDVPVVHATAAPAPAPRTPSDGSAGGGQPRPAVPAARPAPPSVPVQRAASRAIGPLLGGPPAQRRR